MKKMKLIGVTVVLLLAIASFATWLTFRHPHDAKYFTPEMQTKYSTLESVLDAWRTGWKCNTPEREELISEVYGWSDPDKQPNTGEMPPIKEISYTKDKEMAFVYTENSMWTFIKKKNRWVRYPETPWGGFVIMAHN